MHCLYRYGSFLLSLLVIASISLSGCSRAPHAYFQPGSRPVYEHTVRAVAPASLLTEPAADLTASLSDVPPSPSPSVAKVAPVSVEPAIRVDVRRPTIWSAYKRMVPRKPSPPQCDQIVLRNGDVIDAKVKEVGVNEIRYKKCDRQDGPDYTILKRDVLSIKYSNGEVERFGNANTTPSYNNNSSSSGGRSYESPTNPQNGGARTDAFAIVAIAAGGVAVLASATYGAFFFGAIALIFGALSLTRIKREPGRFKGRGLALGGMIAGIVAVGIVLLLILL